MIGFELEIKGKKILVESPENGSAVLVADIVKGKVTVSCSGMDFKENNKQESIQWLDETNLNIGDEFIVRVKNIQKPSQPIKIKEIDFRNK